MMNNWILTFNFHVLMRRTNSELKIQVRTSFYVMKLNKHVCLIVITNIAFLFHTCGKGDGGIGGGGFLVVVVGIGGGGVIERAMSRRVDSSVEKLPSYVGIPIILNLIVCSSGQSPSNKGPPEMIIRIS